MVTIAELYVYPVKSCRGIAVDDWPLEAAGLAHDREWMVVTPDGRFLTQRELPRLALVVPRLLDDRLVLAAPGQGDLELPFAAGAGRRDVVVWRDRCAAEDAGDAAGEWLTRFLGRPARLVRIAADARRVSDPQWAGDTGALTRFSDGYALLALSRASLDDLNRRLPAPLPVDRFRPNLVLEGLAPYGEDALADFHAGGAHLRGVKPCTRCVITTTRQSTGEPDGEEPLKTLRTYRWDPKLRGILFGQNVIVVGGAGGRLSRGMPVRLP